MNGSDALLRTARFVAEYWRDAVMGSDELRRTGMSHPLAMVLAALDGETDPAQCGIDEAHAAGFRAALDVTPEPKPPSCDVDEWDGPYKYRCGRRLDPNGKCPRHFLGAVSASVDREEQA